MFCIAFNLCAKFELVKIPGVTLSGWLGYKPTIKNNKKKLRLTDLQRVFMHIEIHPITINHCARAATYDWSRQIRITIPKKPRRDNTKYNFLVVTKQFRSNDGRGQWMGWGVGGWGGGGRGKFISKFITLVAADTVTDKLTRVWASHNRFSYIYIHYTRPCEVWNHSLKYAADCINPTSSHLLKWAANRLLCQGICLLKLHWQT